MAKLKLAALQMDIDFDEPINNCRKLTSASLDAANSGVDVLITPEMFSTGFTMSEEIARTSETATFEAVRACARDNRINIIAGFPVVAVDHKLRNAAVVVNRKGDVIHQYLKTHLFSLMNEDKHYMPGKGASVFELEGVRISLAICYDLRFPELFRQVARQVDVFCVIASWPNARQHHWDTLLRSRAIENQAYIVGVNRVGVGGELFFDGGTSVISPLGNVLCCKYSQEGLLYETIDTEQVAVIRDNYPFLQDIKLI
ncbi:MAG: carbon-nitrogen family hydrolase [Deltaproteobacteria bacterium]|nr:carbon-nitrogen family hydrolase [Deltaproteobacteria bacterium]